MSGLNDTYTLRRSGSYSDPLDSNDKLPIIYGDLSDGISGNWELPCLNATDWVYAFAGHEVLSIANGNSIVIYEDGLVLTGGGTDYTFNAKNDYEGHGDIATIDMVNPKLNATITATGMGKPTTTGGAALMENIIDILYDFLTVENSFTSADFNLTKKAMATDIFDSQSYKAAGVINEDTKFWAILQEMMASFLGSVYIDANDQIVLEIEDGTSLYTSSAIIPKSEISFISAKQRKVSLINQCPANYAYAYVEGEFRSHTDDSAYADIASQGIYGTCEPNIPYQFYWCRDSTSIHVMQGIITAKYGRPTWEIEFDDLTLKRSHIDVGDIVAATFVDIYNKNEEQLINQLIKILSVQYDFAGMKVKFSGINTGLYLTFPGRILDGSWILDGSVILGGDRDTTIY